MFRILKKTLKSLKRMYSFTGHLITLPSVFNYRKSVPVKLTNVKHVAQK